MNIKHAQNRVLQESAEENWASDAEKLMNFSTSLKVEWEGWRGERGASFELYVYFILLSRQLGDSVTHLFWLTPPQPNPTKFPIEFVKKNAFQ